MAMARPLWSPPIPLERCFSSYLCVSAPLRAALPRGVESVLLGWAFQACRPCDLTGRSGMRHPRRRVRARGLQRCKSAGGGISRGDAETRRFWVPRGSRCHRSVGSMFFWNVAMNHGLGRPFRAWIGGGRANPGRCPGLACVAPLALPGHGRHRMFRTIAWVG